MCPGTKASEKLSFPNCKKWRCSEPRALHKVLFQLKLLTSPGNQQVQSWRMGRVQKSQVKWGETAGEKIFQRNFLYLQNLRKVVFDQVCFSLLQQLYFLDVATLLFKKTQNPQHLNPEENLSVHCSPLPECLCKTAFLSQGKKGTPAFFLKPSFSVDLRDGQQVRITEYNEK